MIIENFSSSLTTNQANIEKAQQQHNFLASLQELLAQGNALLNEQDTNKFTSYSKNILLDLESANDYSRIKRLIAPVKKVVATNPSLLQSLNNIKDTYMKNVSEFKTIFDKNKQQVSSQAATTIAGIVDRNNSLCEPLMVANAPSGNRSTTKYCYNQQEIPLILITIVAVLSVVQMEQNTAQVISQISSLATKVLNELNSYQGMVTTISSFYTAMVGMQTEYYQSIKQTGSGIVNFNDPKMAAYVAAYNYMNKTSKFAGSRQDSNGNFEIRVPTSSIPPQLLPFFKTSITCQYNYIYSGSRKNSPYFISLPPYYNDQGQLVVDAKSGTIGNSQTYTFTFTPGKGTDWLSDATIQIPDKKGGYDDIKVSDLDKVSGSGYIPTYTTDAGQGYVYINLKDLENLTSYTLGQVALAVPGLNPAPWLDALSSSGNVNNLAQYLAQLVGTINSFLGNLTQMLQTIQNAIQQRISYFTTVNQSFQNMNSQLNGS